MPKYQMITKPFHIDGLSAKGNKNPCGIFNFGDMTEMIDQEIIGIIFVPRWLVGFPSTIPVLDTLAGHFKNCFVFI